MALWKPYVELRGSRLTILGGLCTVLAVGSVQFLGQERIVSYDSRRCRALSEALAWLTKVNVKE